MSGEELQKNISNIGLEEKKDNIVHSNQKDSRLDYFSERAKKLTTAVYLVTNLIPATDPLRTSARELSIKLLNLVGRTPSGQTFFDIQTEANGMCKKVVEMLEIALFSGYVSEMNFSVLKSEFDIFASELLTYSAPQETITPESLQATVFLTPPSQKIPVSKAVFKEKVIPVKDVVDAKKSSRKEAILSIIRKRGAVNIKDISSVVIDCSEKTIQRELSSLVAVGTLKRSGERRWSLYSLAN